MTDYQLYREFYVLNIFILFLLLLFLLLHNSILHFLFLSHTMSRNIIFKTAHAASRWFIFSLTATITTTSSLLIYGDVLFISVIRGWHKCPSQLCDNVKWLLCIVYCVCAIWLQSLFLSSPVFIVFYELSVDFCNSFYTTRELKVSSTRSCVQFLSLAPRLGVLYRRFFYILQAWCSVKRVVGCHVPLCSL